ncbi:DUF1835 domain-containing protein [Paenibacillus glycanilyticus]|uniref:DUF1835 domain-containing protein n=1 Tax=Paenibacillus glycanilyticus TaxID=126569 RepID=A0ABQ6GII8_9BACL|nr:DUF1835 domain-containing protein [Paenibacillus glycanilyticus]GLX70633.1 hypothetical protein MU1_49790 [Paenibacillus glycanilyticus]
MLHIVNGDSVAHTLQQGIVQGDILVWRELYPHGPNSLESTRGNRFARAQYLEQTLGIPHAEFVRNSKAQKKLLEDFHSYEEIVLWFEHDLFDQTMLAYLLHWFSGQSLSNTKLSLLEIGDFPGIEPFRGLGQLNVEQLATLAGTWRPIGAKELALGESFWQAYASPDPSLLQRLLEQDTSALPYAREAFQLHLSRFPSTFNGLGIVEQTTLEMVHTAAQSPFELFQETGNKLHALGMADLEYWYILRKLSHGPFPLLQVQGLGAFPTYMESAASLRDCKVVLTELGEKVMNGEEDWLTLNGINEWYGGVHLLGNSPRWRWDANMRRMKHED